MPVRMRHNGPMFTKAALPILITILIIFAPTLVWADDVISEPPEQAVPDMHYVFYLHGQIVQDVGPRPTHPRYGLYDYPLILEALAADGITVISQRREPGTRPEQYAEVVAKQVNKLLANGAEPGNVTVIGFSVGGVITIRTSSLLVNADINFVILAACSSWIANERDIRLHGHVLSVFEKSDQTTSCNKLAKRTPQPLSFEEFSINTGKEHGAFYLPNEAWLDPVLDWIQR
jgi:hypothetical protein